MKVDTSESFSNVVTCVFLFAHTAWGVNLYKKNGGQEDYAVFSGATLAALVILFETTIYWGSMNLLEHEFEVHGTSSESGRKMMPNTKLASTFKTLMVFAILQLIFTTGVMGTLIAWKDDLTRASVYNDFGGDVGPGEGDGAFTGKQPEGT